jgi:predicted nucleic acid-binding protein
MTLALDSSALVARHLSGPARAVALEAGAVDPDWCASAVAIVEALGLVDRLSEGVTERQLLRRSLLDDWDRVTVVPVDQHCLHRAGELLAAYPLRTVDALHLAAADRLPRPVTWCTFDPRQIPPALALGFDVAST